MNLVNKSSYLTLYYRIATQAGEEFLSTFGMGPATLQMGSGQLAEPLEKCLLGLSAAKNTDERVIFNLSPEEAFGAHNPRLVERIARNALPPEVSLKENTLVEFTTPDGKNFAGFLQKLEENYAVFDFNHPLSGKAIRFEVCIIGIMT